MNKEAEFIKKVRKYRKEILAPYRGWQYVPMGEGRSLPLPVTVSCDYKACLFCDLNQDLPFSEFSLAEIETFLKKEAYIQTVSNRKARRVVLLHGNPLTLSADKLLAIADLIHRYLPEIRGIGGFARAFDILKKSSSELLALKEAGYDHITIGIESGSDNVLAFQNKGVSAKDQLLALQKLDEAGIAYSLYIMLGLGGKEMSEEHVAETTAFLNQTGPKEIIFVSLVLFKNAPLVQLLRQGRFFRQRPYDCMVELYEILRGLTMESVFNATHKTNMFPVKGLLPKQKTELLQKMEKELRRLACEDGAAHEGKRWRSWSKEN